MEKLLSRAEFRESCLARDGNKCVSCSSIGPLSVHHIIERRLWPDGGYYLSNGASLCDPCHLKAEQTILSVEEVRKLAGITKIVVPPHLYPDDHITKWGDYILPNGTRYPGELFDDQSVQKILGLGGVLNLYQRYIKYPRTMHLPWSPAAASKDERVIQSTKAFENQEVIISVKMDGENTTWYRDHIHARSLDYSPHPSRNLIKKLHGEIAWQLPEGWRLVGENVYAKHSIHYRDLDSYFYVISIWNDRNECLSWDETCEWAALLDLQMVPVLYRGPWDESIIRKLSPLQYGPNECEGYVARISQSFHFRDFRNCVAKWVRKDHVQTHAFWRNQIVIPNELRGLIN